jgi:hypothetical protein
MDTLDGVKVAILVTDGFEQAMPTNRSPPFATVRGP